MFRKPRPFAASLAFLLLVAISSDFSPAQTKPPDFSGFWLRDDGGVIKISVNGTNVKAVHVKVVPENREVYGFVPGDTHFEGIAHGRTYTGKVMGHLAVAKWKKLCPGRWASWATDIIGRWDDVTGPVETPGG